MFQISLIIEVIVTAFGLYFGYLAIKAGRTSQYSTSRNVRSSLFFSVFVVLVSLGFMLIVMTTDGTQISDYLAAFLILELIFGSVIFLGCFVSQWLWMKFKTYLSLVKR